jgi:hypothetical protein
VLQYDTFYIQVRRKDIGWDSMEGKNNKLVTVIQILWDAEASPLHIPIGNAELMLEYSVNHSTTTDPPIEAH